VGSVLEKNVKLAAGLKLLQTRNIEDRNDEQIVRWFGPNTRKCDNVVMQALNLYFKSRP